MPDEPYDELRVAEDLASFLADPGGFTLPELMGVTEATDELLALYESSGSKGATYSLRFGDMAGQPYYSVSVWPEREIISRKVSVTYSASVHAFIQDNLALFADPRCCVGLWYNADDKVTYLDIVAVLPERQVAVALAKQYNQIAVFDLHGLAEIETGGSGNTPADMPPAEERLPKINLESKEIR